MFEVVLLEPEIAGNAGAVARTCLAVGARLHLVRPLGFRLTDAAVRRAGMDYWERADVRVHRSWATWAEAHEEALAAGRVHAFTTRAARSLAQASPEPGDVLLFGPESRGLPDAVLALTEPVRLPMRPGVRSLNLATAVSAALYLAWARRGFDGGA